MRNGRRLRAWEIALFVCIWEMADLTVAVSAAAMVRFFGANTLTGIVVLYGLLLFEPCKRWERRSWATIKASHQ